VNSAPDHLVPAFRRPETIPRLRQRLFDSPAAIAEVVPLDGVADLHEGDADTAEPCLDLLGAEAERLELICHRAGSLR